ncbi:hypothetical protein ACH4U6_22345 [Streptomyces netropsis]|uniref:hypothetical protein n=1 Tax=Streptomyces netropsis TaxID=55404 RepID=UPI0037BC7C8A
MSAGTRPRTPGTTAQTRLPWWALVLPAVAFVGLLVLLASPASADTGSTAVGEGTVSRVVEFVRHALQS